MLQVHKSPEVSHKRAQWPPTRRAQPCSARAPGTQPVTWLHQPSSRRAPECEGLSAGSVCTKWNVVAYGLLSQVTWFPRLLRCIQEEVPALASTLMGTSEGPNWHHPQLLGSPIQHCLLRTPALRRRLLMPAASPLTPRAGASGKCGLPAPSQGQGKKRTCSERTAPPCQPAASPLGGGVRDRSTVRAMSL